MASMKYTNGTTTARAEGTSSSLGVHDMAAAQNGDVPIAICGMAFRLPGGLTTCQQLWEFLLSKGDARSRVPVSRYNISAYYDPSDKPGTIKTEYGYFLNEDVDLGALDASFFNMSRTELERADPHQRQMLEVTRECFEDAGETDWRGRRIGCYMGSFGEDWCEQFGKEAQQYGLYRVSGYGDFMLSNRISYEMDLRGPSMTIRSGCSAALVALHEARVAIMRGDCTAAIVGGANLILGPGMTAAMTEQGVLSPDGSCKTFSADADGYSRGEAISAIFIKPLADALRDGNPIRAVIRSTATNCDGKTPGLSSPSVDAHESMMKRAYECAGITDISLTGFVECHGTGTAVGDPIEAEAVARIFGPVGGVYIGSIKPNLGHSEGASGITSLIKTVLALEHRTIPPNIKFTTPNPKIPFEEAKLVVPTEPIEWPQSKAERASINSFGIGGSNAHVIIDSANSFMPKSERVQTADEPQLLLYSANSPQSLSMMIENFRDFVIRNPMSADDLGYTLAVRRKHHMYRAFAIASPHGVGAASAVRKISLPPVIVMVFTGQGAQWAQMGRDLFRSDQHTVFRDSIRSLDSFLKSTSFAPDWTIEQELLKSRRSSRLNKAELSQPVCTALQVALVDTLAFAGVEPGAVVGHSSGEIAAAYAAGSITAQEAITIAFYRGVAAKHQTKAGGMAAVGLGWNDIQGFLVEGVVVACDNSPNSVTLSGDVDRLDLVVKQISSTRPDVLLKKLSVDKAYHSHHMDEVGSNYMCLIQDKLNSKPPAKLLFSTVTGSLLNKMESLGPKYWEENLRSPVRFKGAVSNILQHEIGKNCVFIEVGPHSALAGSLRQIQAQHSNTAPYVPLMIREQNSVETLLTAMGTLYQLSIPILFEKLYSRGLTLPDLPRYPWNHKESYWYESRISKESRHRQFPHHDLLGIRISESTDFTPSWRNLFHLDSVVWVQDHKIGDDVVFPFAGYAAMAGEAVRQISGVEEGYSLRHVLISTALVLGVSNKPVEIITSLKRHRLTDALDSDYWEFVIASYNGQVWTKHCTGEVKPVSENVETVPTAVELDRKLSPRRCYQCMRRAGLNYGPAFQCLANVEAATMSQAATANALNDREDRHKYHLHPTLIDAALQLLSAAATKGYLNAFSMMVPTKVESLTVQRCFSNLGMSVSANFGQNGAIVGEGCCFSNGSSVLRMDGVQISLVGEEGRTDIGAAHPTARMKWAPHIDFMNSKDLIRPSINHGLYGPTLDELAQLSLISADRALHGLITDVPHMQKFQAWVSLQLASRDLSTILHLSDAAISQKIEAIVHQLSMTPAAPAVEAISRIYRNMKAIFSGQLKALEILLEGNLLNKLYNYTDQCDRSSFILSLAHSKPSLRILEIGAGTGATSASILKDLALPDGSIYFSKYMFTDVSSGFLPAAKERFALIPNMDFATLDISRDPWEQGFDESSQYDLILATNVIHATPSLHESLVNIRKLLAQDGRLLLHEINSEFKWMNYIFGTLAGWWYGEADGRLWEPYVSTRRWEDELQAAGFQGIDALTLDSEKPFQLNAIMVAKPSIKDNCSRSITVLCDGKAACQSEVVQRLQQKGYAIHQCTLNDIPVARQDVVALLDIERPFFAEMDSARFEAFKAFLSKLDSAGVLWVTKLCQIHCKDPQYAQVIGVARTIRAELSIEFATCEVDDLEKSSDLVVDVFSKFQRREVDKYLGPNFEYAVYDRTVNVGRFSPFSLIHESLTSMPNDKVSLLTSKFGRLDNLYWCRQPCKPAEGDEVEVEMHSAGLNFRDVLIAMGVIAPGGLDFGFEGAGIVRRKGALVKNLSCGDRVMFLSAGAFADEVTVSEQLCVKIPDHLDFDDAATMPCVYATAIYALFDVGRLEQGQSILIHSACGGVGIAAIQLARMVGAEIYATVGNDEKVDYLMKTFSLPRNRIFNSRTPAFTSDIMRETNNRGVDLALNSLSGELLHATWRCIAVFGKMIEIGKRDLLSHGKLDMDLFAANRSYCCVDLAQVCTRKPSLSQRLLKLASEYFSAGHILPIRPKTIFGAARVQDAFRYMQQGQHTGKIVISIRDSSGNTCFGDEIVRRKASLKLEETASYLLVGGLGGLGRVISRWMVEHGARHLIYLSRSAGVEPSHIEFVRELESMGCQVCLVQGSVSNANDVEKAVAQGGDRLKGILQMSMLLRDQAFLRMTMDEWKTTTMPKMEGTWNLHNATLAAGLSLDFLVLFSSISGTVGQPGQANYAGANTFLDSFAQYRASLGLAASVIDIGVVEDVGYVAENEALAKRFKDSGVYTVPEEELLESIAAAMTSLSVGGSAPTHQTNFTFQNGFVLGLATKLPLKDPENRAPWKNDIRMAIYLNSAGRLADPSASDDSLGPFLAKARGDASLLQDPESVAFLALEIGKKLFSFLLKPGEEVRTSRALTDLGMDSLVAYEMRNWWKQVFGFDISVLELLGKGTLDALGQHAADGLLQSIHGEDVKPKLPGNEG